MAHELDFTLGRAAIAYAGEVPWHGFGVNVPKDISPDEMREAAGLGWEVIPATVSYNVKQHEIAGIPMVPEQHVGQHEVPSRKALLRSDTYDLLSIVSDRYVVAQPSKVFQFFNELMHQQGITMEVAGALKGGKRIWALGAIDDSFTLYGQDTVKPYVMMATSYDAAMATQAMLTDIRVVCNNTITYAGAYESGERGDRYAVPHTQEFDITAAHGKLGLNEAAWLEHKRQMEALAAFRVSADQALEFFYSIAGQGKEIVRNPDNGAVISFPEPNRVVKQYIQAYKQGPGAHFQSANGTAFGLLNAVTFYQDHMAPAKNAGNRFDSATFAAGATRKQFALDTCLKMLEAA
jgi:phage/plasmid-like protein (TIGR03299 family)